MTKKSSEGDWPVFIINLPDAVDRRNQLIAQLEQHQIKYDLFEATDGRSGLPEGFGKYIDRDAALLALGRVLTDAEFACAISHIRVYETIVKGDLSGAIVLEDDAILCKGFSEFYAEGYHETLDFLQFNYGFARVWRWGVEHAALEDSIEIRCLVSNSGLASAYSISRKGAKHVLENALPLKLPADWPCDLRALRPKVTVPRLATAPSGDLSQSHLENVRSQAKLNQRNKVLNKSGLSLSLNRQRNPKPPLIRLWGRLLTQII